MKFIIIMAITLSSICVSAQTKTTADKVLIKAEPMAYNGFCKVERFNLAGFKYEVSMKKFSSDARDSFGKGAVIDYKWNDVVRTIRSSVGVGQNGEYDFYAAIDSVVAAKKIKAMFSATPGESCEECFETNFLIYFKDGSSLYCNFDYST